MPQEDQNKPTPDPAARAKSARLGASAYESTAQAGMDREKLVREHAPLVKKVAYRIVSRLPDSVDVEDLMSAGMIGLLEARDRYEPSRGPFAAFAEWRIKGRILDELRGFDHLTRTQRQKATAADKIRREIEQEMGRDASVEEVADASGLDINEVAQSLVAASGPVFISLDDLGLDREDIQDILGQMNERGGPLNGEQFTILVRTKRRLVKVLKTLKPREQTILSLYYVEELNYREIGEILELTESRICQIVRSALQRLGRKLGD